MKSLTPFIIFPGTCKTALEFYRECFGGEIVYLQTYAEAPMGAPEGHGERIFNSLFQAENILFGASDCMPDDQVQPGRNIALHAHFTVEEEFNGAVIALADRGTVMMPPEKDTEGPKFCMLADRFGILWMLDYQQQLDPA